MYPMTEQAKKLSTVSIFVHVRISPFRAFNVRYYSIVYLIIFNIRFFVFPILPHTLNSLDFLYT